MGRSGDVETAVPELEDEPTVDPEGAAAADVRNAPGAEVPEPGWYADPTRPGQVRWWDGSAWSDHVRPDTEGGEQT